MPIKSLSASSLVNFQKYSSMLAGNAAYEPPVPAYDLLETEILTGSQSSVTFSNLNSTYGADYQHLQIRAVARSTFTAESGPDNIGVRFNGDTTKNYALHFLSGNGSSVFSTGATSVDASRITAGYISNGLATSGAFGATIIDILDPFETTKYTTLRSLGGASEQRLALHSGVWLSTNAITSVTLLTSYNFVQYSRFSLYGLKGA